MLINIVYGNSMTDTKRSVEDWLKSDLELSISFLVAARTVTDRMKISVPPSRLSYATDLPWNSKIRTASSIGNSGTAIEYRNHRNTLNRSRLPAVDVVMTHFPKCGPRISVAESVDRVATAIAPRIAFVDDWDF